MAEASGLAVNLIQVAGDEPERPDVPAAADTGMRWLVVEQLLEGWPLVLSDALHRQWGMRVRIRRESLALTRLSAVARNTPPGALIGALDTAASDDAIVVIDPVTVFGVLEFVLGDREMKTPLVPERPPTPFESGVMRPLVKTVCDTFAASLSAAGALPLRHRGWVTGEGLADSAAILATISVSFGEAEGRIALAVPLSVLAPVSAALAGLLHGRDVASAAAWHETLAAHVAEARVTVTAIAFDGSLTLKHFAQLREGNSLELDRPADAGATLVVDGQIIGTGRIGRSGSNIAIRLDRPVAAGKKS